MPAAPARRGSPGAREKRGQEEDVCSTWCQRSDRSATSYSAGTCHAQNATTNETHATRGSVRTPVSRRTGPVASTEATARRARSGSPASSGATGAPSQQRGRHYHQQQMLDHVRLERRWPSASTGEQSARSTTPSPLRTPPRARPRSARACAAGAPPSRAGRARRPPSPARPPPARSSTRARPLPGPRRRVRRPGDSCAGIALCAPSGFHHASLAAAPARVLSKHTSLDLTCLRGPIDHRVMLRAFSALGLSRRTPPVTAQSHSSCVSSAMRSRSGSVGYPAPRSTLSRSRRTVPPDEALFPARAQALEDLARVGTEGQLAEHPIELLRPDPCVPGDLDLLRAHRSVPSPLVHGTPRLPTRSPSDA